MEKKFEADLSLHTISQHGHNLSPGHDYRTKQRPPALNGQPFLSGTTKDATIRAVSLMTQDRFHSPTRSAASISPFGDQMSDVTTRADDRWARLTLLLWSQREEDWRERVKSGKMVSTIEPPTVLTPHLSAAQGSESVCQIGKTCTKCQQRLSTQKRDCWKEAKVLREKASREGGNGQKDGRAEEQGFPICSKTASATSPSSHSRTDERSPEKRSTEQDRVRTWTGITNSHGSSEQQYQRSPRGRAQGTGSSSRVPATNVRCSKSQMQEALQQQVCALTGAIQKLAETQQVATAWTSEETRRKTSRG